MNCKILVVEDDARDLEVLKQKLSGEHYTLVHAVDGASALMLIEKEKPDMVILDVLLPDIDGFEVCRRIRRNEQNVSLPVLFHTTVSTTDEKLLGLHLGASDFLTKDSDERELLVRIRNLLQLKKSVDELVTFSVIDALTRVYNKVYFEHRVNDEIERSRRYQRSCSCVILDIDEFNKVNEGVGHVAGDKVLQQVAEITRQNIRRADVLCRYGGDEFGWLLPETGIDEAFVAAEKIRQVILRSEIGKEDAAVALTLSCGVSGFSDAIVDRQALLEQTEAALNKAKQRGRNQTWVFTSEG